MRVVVTGASGDFGSSIVPALLRRGHEVHGVSRRAHQLPFASYRHTACDVRDADGLAKVIAGADAVVHLAWTTHPMHDAEATRAIDVGGTAAVVEAMRATGVGRIIFTSSVMAYGANADNPDRLVETDRLRPSKKHIYSLHKAEAERLIADAGAEALLIRATTIMGRDSTGVTAEGFALPRTFGINGAQNRMQFIHPDDLARFYVEAVERPLWVGPVNLAAADVVAIQEIARILGKKTLEVNGKIAESVLSFLWDRGIFSLDPGAIEALTHFPIVDITRLVEDFGFQPVWSSRGCVEDFGRANRAHIYLGAKRVRIPWRWPYTRVPAVPDPSIRQPAAPPSVAGEFDTLVEPDYPVFTAANTSEASPGPMTPLSVEFSLEAMRAAGRQCAEVLRLDGELARILTENQVGVFGHGVYANMTVVLAMAEALPGNDRSAWEDMLFGEAATAAVPELERVSSLSMLKRLPGLAAKAVSFMPETSRIDREARDAQRDAEWFALLSDAALTATLRRIGDDGANAWATASQGAVFITAVMGAIEKQAGKRFAATIRGGAEELASAGILRGCQLLADRARADTALAADLALGNEAALSAVRERHPAFAAEVETLLHEYGHRGPRETELANEVFADAPARLLGTISKLASSPPRVTAEMSAMGPGFGSSPSWVRPSSRHVSGPGALRSGTPISTGSPPANSVPAWSPVVCSTRPTMSFSCFATRRWSRRRTLATGWVGGVQTTIASSLCGRR